MKINVCMQSRASMVLLAVFTNEMNLSGSGWDPTIEEGLHLITHMGYAHAYPDIFGQNKDSHILQN